MTNLLLLAVLAVVALYVTKQAIRTAKAVWLFPAVASWGASALSGIRAFHWDGIRPTGITHWHGLDVVGLGRSGSSLLNQGISLAQRALILVVLLTAILVVARIARSVWRPSKGAGRDRGRGSRRQQQSTGSTQYTPPQVANEYRNTPQG